MTIKQAEKLKKRYAESMSKAEHINRALRSQHSMYSKMQDSECMATMFAARDALADETGDFWDELMISDMKDLKGSYTREKLRAELTVVGGTVEPKLENLRRSL